MNKLSTITKKHTMMQQNKNRKNTNGTSGGPTKVAEMAPEKIDEHEHALTY